MFVKNLTCMILDSSATLPKIGTCAIPIKLAELLFDSCYYCEYNKLTMPAIPQGAFAACKVREHEQQIAKVQAAEQGDEKMFYNRKYLELSPLKYNSKLMNSIWGLYNRYSVHNFKKITDAEDVTLAAGSQQMATATADLPTTMDKLSTHAKASPSQPLPTATVLVADWIHVWGTHKSY